MNKLRMAWTLAIAVILLLAAGCGSAGGGQTADTKASPAAGSGAAAQPQTRTVKHALGETVIPAQPKRMLVMYPRYAQDLMSLGIMPQAIAASQTDRFPPYLDEMIKSKGILTMKSGSYENFNMEEVLALQPDLIVITTVYGKTYDQLSKIAPTIAADHGDWRHVLPQLAAFFGKEAEGQKVVADFDAKAAAAKQKLQATLGAKTVMMLRIEEKQFRFVGGSKEAGFTSRLLYHDLGLRLPESLKSATAWATPISLEGLVQANPDVMFIEVRPDQANTDKRYQDLQNEPLWKNINAVKTGQVFTVNHDLWIQGDDPVGFGKVIDEITSRLVK